jgi:DNA-directed RNA polymerase subunit RPC12/RpoP
MTEKPKCHICGKEVTENYYIDSRGYTCYLCSKAIASEKSKIQKIKEWLDEKV